ncbi:unnamed protein product [Aspergillus oryzae]|nr:unnamed protein product [Aspergillus oryzae]
MTGRPGKTQDRIRYVDQENLRALQGGILEPSAGNNAPAATSPVMGGVSHPSASATGGPDGVGPARKRTVAMAGLDSSPGSVDDVEENDLREEKKRQPVKRACNECLQDPWMDCSRCRRLKLDCKIESNFKRVGKRSRNAEMEREIIELRKQIASVQANAATSMPQQQPPSIQSTQHTPKQEHSSHVSPAGVYHTPSGMSSDQYMGSHEAVASLLDLRSGFDVSNYMRNGSQHFKRIEDVVVVPERVTELFDLPRFATGMEYAGRHPTKLSCRESSLPALYMAIPYEQYFYRSHLYALWNDDAGGHAARSTPPVICSGFQVATGYGQPPSTLYDWTLSSESLDPNYKLPEGIRARLQIEKFCDQVTRALYTNHRDPVGLCNDQERSTLISFFSRDFDELESQLKAQNDCEPYPWIHDCGAY